MVLPVLQLASASPRRSRLLREAGIPFEVVEPGLEPEGPAGLSPVAAAVVRARAKAQQARWRKPHDAPGGEGGDGVVTVLGVDTVVDLDGGVLGKARSVDAARATLRMLQGREHAVHTAHCLVVHAWGRQALLEEVVTARVCHDPVAESVLEAYLGSGEWRGKAGAYGIQDPGAAFVQLVGGDLDTVIGLHLAAVRRLLLAANAWGAL